MASDTFTLEIVTPQKIVVDRAVGMATVPCAMGEIGVLAAHAPLMTALTPGIVTVYDRADGPPVERYFVAGGFVDVSETRCALLADDAMPVSQLDRAHIETELEDVTMSLSAASDDADIAALTARLAIAEAKMKAIAV